MLLIRKCEGEKLDRTVKQKEPELDDVGNSQPIQLVEDAAMRRSTVREVDWRRPQGQPGKEACAHGCPQPAPLSHHDHCQDPGPGRGRGRNLQDGQEMDRRFLRSSDQSELKGKETR